MNISARFEYLSYASTFGTEASDISKYKIVDSVTQESTVFSSPLMATAGTNKVLNLPTLQQLGDFNGGSLCENWYGDANALSTVVYDGHFNYAACVNAVLNNFGFAGISAFDASKSTTFIATLADNVFTTPSVKLPEGSCTATYTYQFWQNDGHIGYAARVVYVFSAVAENSDLGKKYTVWDVAQRCLDLAIPIFKGTDGEGDKTRYILDPEQEEWLSSIIAPELSMTQANLREQLRVIGGYIHAIPRLIFPNIIHFDRLGGETRSDLLEHPYSYNSYAHTINSYCTHLATMASNLVDQSGAEEGTITDPTSKSYRSLRTESINVRVEEGNAYADTAYPIQIIAPNGIKCGIYDAEEGGWWLDPVDITDYCFEETAYFSLLSSYTDSYPYSKAYGIYYGIGKQGIRGLFFKPEDAVSPALQRYAIANILGAVNTNGRTAGDIDQYLVSNQGKNIGTLVFQITYAPIYQAYLSQGKQLARLGARGFGLIYNQSENLIDTEAFGENLRGAAARLGNLDGEMAFFLPPDMSLLPKIGDMVAGYAISAVLVTVMPIYFKVTVALTRDFNRISQYIGVDSIKRVYEVSERQSYNRLVNIHEYVLVGDDPYNTPNTPNLHDGSLASSISPTLVGLLGVDTQNLRATHVDMIGADANNGTSAFYGIRLPVVSSAIGNNVVMSWKCKDNYSAGTQNVYQINSVSGEETYGWWLQDVPYSNYAGRIEYLHFETRNRVGEADGTLETANNLPQYPYNSAAQNEFTVGTSQYHPYHIRKDSREALSFTYAQEYISNREGLIVTSLLAKHNPMVNNNRSNGAIIVASKAPIGRFQNGINLNDRTTYSVIGVVDGTVESLKVSDKQARIPSFVVPSGYISWAIVAEPDLVGGVYTSEAEIYIASNIDVSASNTTVPAIYLTTAHSIHS